jgi:hypothetical protein
MLAVATGSKLRQIRHVTKPVTKRRTCAWCKVRFRPTGRGRPPTYCSASHRQRAYEARRFREAAARQMPQMLFKRDWEGIRTSVGIDKAVLNALRRFGIIPTAATPVSKLRLVKNEDREDT